MAKINFKHKQLVLHPSELDIKGMRLRRWLELGLFESSGSSVNAEGLTTTCSLPAAINGATASLGKALEGKIQRSCPGKDGNTGTPRQAVQVGWGHRDVQLPNTGIVCGMGAGKGQPQALSPQQVQGLQWRLLETS